MSTRRVIRTTGIALVAVLGIGLYLRMAWAKQAGGESEAAGLLDPKTYVSGVVPDGENAGPWLRAAAQALVLTKEQRSFVGDLTMTPAEQWTPAQHEQLRALVAQSHPVFELLQRALPLERTSYDLNVNDLESVELNPHKLPWVDVIWLQRFLYATAEDALQRGDKDGFLATVAPMPLIAVSLEREAPLLPGMVGIACDKMVVDLVRQAVARPDVDSAMLDKLDRLIPQNDLRAVWARAIASEFALGPFRGGQASVPLKPALPVGGNLPRRALVAAFSEAFDDPFGSSPSWLTEEERRITGAAGTDLAGGAASVQAVGRFQHTLSGRRLAHLAIELRRDAMRTGAYPLSLSAFPGASAADPFYGVPPTLSINPDRSAVLTVPGAEAAYKRLYGSIRAPELYLWQLPAPVRP